MDINAYLQRIHYKGDLYPNVETLRELQRHHLRAVPFENLDIHIDKPIELDIQKFYQKVVVHKRGGFCYELNSLFNELLKALNFQTKIISACVWNESTGFSPDYAHLAILVRISDVEFLTDVGFGSFTLFPLEINLKESQQDESNFYRISKLESNWLQVNCMNNDKVVPVYKFQSKRKNLRSFTDMCAYQQYNPNSHFRKGRLITRPIPGGRITLSDQQLKFTGSGIEKNIPVSAKNPFEVLLWEHFHIRM